MAGIDQFLDGDFKEGGIFQLQGNVGIVGILFYPGFLFTLYSLHTVKPIPFLGSVIFGGSCLNDAPSMLLRPVSYRCFFLFCPLYVTFESYASSSTKKLLLQILFFLDLSSVRIWQTVSAQFGEVKFLCQFPEGVWGIPEKMTKPGRRIATCCCLCIRPTSCGTNGSVLWAVTFPTIDLHTGNPT